MLNQMELRRLLVKRDAEMEVEIYRERRERDGKREDEKTEKDNEQDKQIDEVIE